MRARRHIQERHEFVGEAGHRATDTDAADIGTATDASHPAPLADIALHDGPPASELDDALPRTMPGGEIALLVITGPVTTFMDGFAEEPGRSQ